TKRCRTTPASPWPVRARGWRNPRPRRWMPRASPAWKPAMPPPARGCRRRKSAWCCRRPWARSRGCRAPASTSRGTSTCGVASAPRGRPRWAAAGPRKWIAARRASSCRRTWRWRTSSCARPSCCATSRNATSNARISLAVLLGKGPDRGLQIAPPAGSKPVSLAVPPDLVANLLGRRPDLVAARWRVEAAAHDIKAAKAQFMPNLNISAMAGFLAIGDNVPLFQLPARTYSVGPALSLPLFDGKRLRAGLGARDALYDEAVANYNQTLVRAVNQVADLLSLSRSVQSQLQMQQGVL